MLYKNNERLDSIYNEAFKDEMSKTAFWGVLGRALLGGAKTLGRQAVGLGKGTLESGKTMGGVFAKDMAGKRMGVVQKAGSQMLGAMKANPLATGVGLGTVGTAAAGAIIPKKKEVNINNYSGETTY